MSWLFSSSSKDPVQQKNSEQEAEKQLFDELPEELGSFLKTKNREHFTFKEPESSFDPEFHSYKNKNPPNAVANFNCADLQKAFSDCLSSGSVKERLLFCQEHKDKFRACMEFQKNVLDKLGINHTESITMYEKIADKADEIGAKWTDKVEKLEKTEILPPAILNDIYDKRDEIWK